MDGCNSIFLYKTPTVPQKNKHLYFNATFVFNACLCDNCECCHKKSKSE